jgi:hypothetical protein
MKSTKLNIDDDFLRHLVQAREKEIPAATENKLSDWYKRASSVKPSRKRNRLLLSFTMAAVFVLLIVSLNLMLSSRKKATNPLLQQVPFSEIKMELELKDKNIKIIWFQKEGFTLRKG